MKVQYTPIYTNFKSNNNPKEKFTDKFSSRIKNSADLNDCVPVPRTIFKGYLAFMLGTSMSFLGGFVPNKKIRNSMLIAGNLINTYGIWAFARPYILKDAVPSVKGTAKLENN